MSPRTFSNAVKDSIRRAPVTPPRVAVPRPARVLLSAALALFYAACAAGSRDPATTTPRAGGPPYPILLAASDERRAGAAANWLALAGAQGTQAAPPQQPEFQPVTSTVRALPTAVPEGLRLPLVTLGEGDGADAEEATRESLRRFIASARDLLGVNPEDLSLVETRAEAGGARLARYMQKPFPHPLRNGFGLVEIRFAPDRRVLSLSSTALPDKERIVAALTALRPNLIPAADVAARLAGRSLSPAASPAAQTAAQTFTLAAGDPVDVRELVVFPVRPAANSVALEIRLAWETVVGRGGTNLLVHVDAVTGETISAEPTTETPRPAPSATPTPTPLPTQTPAPTATPPVASPTRPAPSPQATPSPVAPPTPPVNATPAPLPPAVPPPARAKSL